MYSVSSNYKTGIYGNSRMNKGRVTFDISDVTANSDIASTTVTSESTLSLKSNLTDKVRTPAFKFATQENNRMVLDGSWTFADQTLANNGEIGWASDVICDSTGTFATPQVITVTFNGNHSSIGLTVTFDPLNNEYATDFTVQAYDVNNTMITNILKTGNTLAQVVAYTNGTSVNYRKVVVTINKWSVPNRRARVMEVDFGAVQVYTGDNSLVKLQLIEELDLTTGNVASPEFRFTVDNSSKQFNILNPSGFYKSLQQRQQVIGEIGLVNSDGTVEWVPVGNYLLWEWQSDEGSLTATFFSRTKLDVMATYSYQNLTTTTITLYDLAVNIFNQCGVTNYSIDTALRNITTNGLIKSTNCKNVLQMIAIAGQANIFVTRNNVITLKVLPAATTSVDTISLNDQYDEPRINLDKIIQQVNVSYYTDLNTQNVVSVTASGATNGGDTLQLDGNTLINTSAQATAVANWVIAQKNNRSIYTLNWRGNQAHELGDVIAIGNNFGNPLNAYITRTELKYEGYVQATTELRGASN